MSDTSSSWLVERVARLEDERAIAGTLYDYGTALDYGDRRLFLDCFVEDAAYVVTMRLTPDGGFTYEGHDALGKYFDAHTHAPAAYHKHVTVNPVVVWTGDTATATSYFLRVDAAPASGPATILASGRYIDQLVRGDDGRWRIADRRCEVENL